MEKCRAIIAGGHIREGGEEVFDIREWTIATASEIVCTTFPGTQSDQSGVQSIRLRIINLIEIIMTFG